MRAYAQSRQYHTIVESRDFRQSICCLIFYYNLRQVLYDYEDKINSAVFPGFQGSPHNHKIAGLVIALKQVIYLFQGNKIKLFSFMLFLLFTILQ